MLNPLILNAEPSGYALPAKKILLSHGALLEKDCDREELLNSLSEVEILIVRLRHNIDEEVMAAAPKLKAIVSATTGLNHIDLDMAKTYGIDVLSLKGEREFLDTITATAELTWGLLISLVRHIPGAHSHVLHGVWQRDIFRGTQLSGKTLGVVGFGRLGSMVAGYGHAFRMNVLATDPFVNQYPDFVKPVSLIDLFRHSDVISLHVNLDASTRNLIDRDVLAKAKNGAFLINTSRGELIDEHALLESLESGRIGGVGLDVLSGEVDGGSDWLSQHPLYKYALRGGNVMFSPHIGGATYESMSDAEVYMAKKIADYICTH